MKGEKKAVNKCKKIIAALLAIMLTIIGVPMDGIMASETNNQESIIDYVIVNSPYVQTPDTQKIIIGSQYASEMDAVKLNYSNIESKETFSAEVSEVTEEALLFEIECNTQDSGKYQLDGIEYTYQGQNMLIEFSSLGIEAYYGVDTEISTNPDAEIVDDNSDAEIETNIVSFDENGEQQSENSISEAIEESESDSVEATAGDMSLTQKTYNSDRTVVVVLDPGHDATHSGAHSANGLQEADLTLKIAQYCYDELTQYKNVSVYMTRTSSSCPYPGTSSGDDNENRVNFAKSVNADIYVSIHLNSAGNNSGPSGAEVYYPNGNYNSTANAIGKGVGESILTQLSALGLNNRGVKIRNSENGTTYADGSLADYYGVIRNSKKNGITGIIIEHAFLSNTSDVSSHLSTNDQLKALGVADATGIANYYSLSKSTTVYNGIDYAAVFDSDYYYNNNSDVAKSCGKNSSKLLEHFVKYGMSEGRQAIESFDVKSYKNRYKDLRQEYGNDLKSYYYHYINYGCAEGRVATGDVTITDGITVYKGIDYSSVYDYSYYMQANPDVAAAYAGDDIKALEHFVNYGMAEGRQAIGTFDVAFYRNRYKDLRQAFGDDIKAYYTHYMNFGKAEGRLGHKAYTVYNGVDYALVYDYDFYIANNADVAKEFKGNDAAALQHFVEYGMKEGRQAISSFNVNTYKNRYPDLRAAYLRDLPSYYRHYITCGYSEGRSGAGNAAISTGITVWKGVDYSDVYDYNYYLKNNSDVAAAFGTDDISVLEHFVTYGMKEGRLGKSSFDVISYKNLYKDLRLTFGNDLSAYYMHYITSGKAEGRVAVGSREITDPITVYNNVDYGKVYDYNYYIQNSPDVYAQYGNDDISILQHFVKFGMEEGRQAKSTFNVLVYSANNQDLSALYGNNWKQYYLHYIDYGYDEGRLAY